MRLYIITLCSILLTFSVHPRRLLPLLAITANPSRFAISEEAADWHCLL